MLQLGDSVTHLKDALDKVLGDKTSDAVVDLSGVTYIDSTGIGELMSYVGRFAEDNRKLLLVNPAPKISRLFKALRLDKAFVVFDDTASALAFSEERT